MASVQPKRNAKEPARGDFRSGSEFRVATQLWVAKVPYEYEARTVYYVQPVKVARYVTDFILPNGIMVEVKGRLRTSDRTKHKYIKQCHPGLDVRFVFDNPNNTLDKNSSTTYAEWAEYYGFRWARREVPQEWIDEPYCKARWAALLSAQEKVKASDYQVIDLKTGLNAHA